MSRFAYCVTVYSGYGLSAV